MKLDFLPGLWPDWTGVSDPPRWLTGHNVRFRYGRPETMGILRYLRQIGGDPVAVALTGGRPNMVKICPRAAKAQVLVGTLNKLFVLEPSPDSTLITGTRWVVSDITPSGIATITDTIGPDLGRAVQSKAWFATVLGNTIVVGRGTVDEPCFLWDRNPAHPAAAISGCPHHAAGAMQSPNQHLILIGCDDESLGYTGLTWRWANQGTVDQWPSDVTSTAGAFELTEASRIIGGGWTGFGGTTWTDTNFWTVDELNDTQNIFRPRKLASDAGLVGANLWCESGGSLWSLAPDMVLRKFQGGTPQPIPCTVGRETFDLMSRESAHRGFMHSVGAHGEIWCWCSTGSAQLPDRAAVYSDREGCWTISRYPRAAMCDRLGPLRPLAVGEDGVVYEHEASIVDDSPSYPNDQPQERSWGLLSALILPPVEVIEAETADVTRLIVDMERVSAPGDEASTIDVTITGYDALRRNTERKLADLTELANDTDMLDFRTGCRSFDLELGATDKTETRFGDMHVGVKKAGSER